MTSPPAGTVTFVFTDIAGSTQRWEHDRAAMAAALTRHNAILERAFAAHGGYVFHTAGDAYGAAFADATSALAAAVDAQRALHAALWDEIAPGFEPLRVRMGIHTGLAELKDGDYVGRPLNRTARLMAAGHGGQVLVSLATQQLVRDALPAGRTLVDLGVHRLKDLEHTEHIYRLVADGYPDVDTPPDTAEKLAASAQVVLDGLVADAACPYRGLHAFREVDAPFFFGREAFTELLIEATAAAPMVGVIGPSGSGKSSVVFAGLVPRLRAGAGNGHAAPPWTVLALRPGSRPFHALAGALVPLVLDSSASEIDLLAEINKLAEHLRSGSIAPHDVLARIGDKHPDVGRLLLVADQFEELYTLGPDEDEHRAFQDLLFATAFDGRGGPPLTLALTLRADFMGHALAYRPFADAVQGHNVVLGPMTRDELARAVRLPAEAQGRAFETGLVERIVDDVGEKAGTLPLLEFALTKLWEQQAAGWLTHDAYEAIGRVEGAVARHADAVYARLGEAEQERARHVFVQLVQPGEGTEDTRRLAVRAEFGPDWPLVQRLADERLVTTSRDESGHETAEVVHEALIRNWERLREWINADRRFRTWQERLRYALRQWEASGHDEGTLLRGAPLAEAEGWLGQRGGELSDGERGYVEAGLDLRDRRARERQAQLEREAASARKLRHRAVFLTVALIAAGGLAIAAIASERRATESAQRAEQASQISLARELAAAATTSIELDPERAMLLALEAVSATHRAGLSSLPEVETVLHRTVNSLQVHRTLLGHTGSVVARWSPTGDEIATVGYDGTVAFWNAKSGKLRQRFDAHDDKLYSSEFSPDGALLATGSADHTIRIWDVSSAKLIRTLEGHEESVLRVKFSPDGELLASSGPDKTVRIWQVADGRQRHRFETAISSGQFEFSTHGGQLVVPGGEGDREAVVWDIERNAEVLRLRGHTDGIAAIRYSPDGVHVATYSRDRTVRIWDGVSGREVTVLSVPDVVLGTTMEFNPKGTILATGTSDANASVRLWNTMTGEQLNRMKGPAGVFSVRFSPDGNLLATTFDSQTFKVWDVESGDEYLHLSGHLGQVTGPRFSPDGRWLVTGSADGTAKIWDMKRKGELPPLASAGVVGWLALSKDGSRFVTTNPGIKIWESQTLSLVSNIDGSSLSPPGKPDFSPDGRWLSSSDVGDPNDAAIWDIRTTQSVMIFEGHTGRVRSTAFSPDGRTLASSALDGTTRLWEVATGRQLQVMDDQGVNKVAFSPDGRQLATVSGGVITRLWDVSTGRQVREFHGHTDSVSDVAFSAAGTKMATVSADGTGHVWDLATAEILTTIVVTGRLIEVSFNHSGTRLATAGTDRTARIWDAATGDELVTLYGHTAPVQDALFSPDDRLLYTAAWDGTVRRYILPLDELVATARARLTRGLTPEECRRYLHMEACPADAPTRADRAP